MSLYDKEEGGKMWEIPEEEHETDECDVCHDNGEHEDRILAWKDSCDLCKKEIAKKATNVVMEFKFEPKDVDTALSWAKSKGYSYEDVGHLIHDAMLDGAIQTDRWASLL